MSGPEKIYRDKLAQGSFEIQRCSGCAKHVFYPRVLCPHCGSGRLEWTAPSGRGTVYSTTVVRRKACGRRRLQRRAGSISEKARA
jgi:uncharacterized OB-fold protein